MNESTGIIHLGAHRGTEVEIYNWFGKNVIWIEASPEIFEKFKRKSFLLQKSEANTSSTE